MSKYKCVQIKGDFFLALFFGGFRKTDLELLEFDWSQIICSAYIYRCMSTHAYLCVLLHFVFYQHTQHVYTITGGSCHRYYFCRDKSVVVTSLLLSWQHVFVTTKHVFCHNKSMLATTKLLSRQNYVCHDKHMQKLTCQDKTFVRTILCLLRQMFVWTKLLSQQKYVCRDKRFITRSILLSQQKTCFVGTNTYTCLSRQTHVCHDKTVFMTKGYLWQLPPVIVYTTHDKTDGLFQASSLPLSIIIVGVGDADFEGQYCHKLFLLFLYWFMSCLSVALRPQKP